MLKVENVEVTYDDVVLVLKGLSMQVRDGQIVALLGANGAGKTTLLRAITGLLDLHEGDIEKGSVTLDDKPIHGLSASKIVGSGIAQVMEGRRIFAEFTVEENLRIGGHTNRREIPDRVDHVFNMFPVLADRRGATAGYLSGGEQQMLAMGRAMMSDPRILILDEPSLGLAPMLVERIQDLIVEINEQGTTVLLVEQNANMALSIADHGYIMETGKIVMDKPAGDLLEDEDVKEFYLGMGGGDPARWQQIKHYKRRKRWLS